MNRIDKQADQVCEFPKLVSLFEQYGEKGDGRREKMVLCGGGNHSGRIEHDFTVNYSEIYTGKSGILDQ